jgi:hypothetical protein
MLRRCAESQYQEGLAIVTRTLSFKVGRQIITVGPYGIPSGLNCTYPYCASTRRDEGSTSSKHGQGAHPLATH